MNIKIIVIVLGTIILIAAVLIGGFRWMTGRPFYTPGMVRAEENQDAPLTPPSQPNDAETWTVEPGIELTHFEVGQGRNALVIHGGPGMPYRLPMRGLASLTNDYRFHYYDQRGCGESTRPFDRFESTNTYANMQTLERTLGLGAQIADIERIRQILGEEQLILVGHSWGGFLAALYAAEFPERVEALVLIAPANVLIIPQPDAESDLFASVRAGLPPEEQAEFDAFMATYMDFNGLFERSEAELVDLNLKFGEYYSRVVDFGTMPEQGRPGGWMVWAQYLSMGQRHDYSAALAAVTAPVLVVHGADDLQSESASRMYAEAFPNAVFEQIANAGHFVFDEQADAFARVVSEFLAGVRE